jgi:hypothetical protein
MPLPRREDLVVLLMKNKNKLDSLEIYALAVFRKLLELYRCCRSLQG